MPAENALTAAQGRWPEILESLGGVDPSSLSGRHCPCPACGGTDRFRFDNVDGTGSAYCNSCGGKDQMGGGMSGIDLLMRVRGWDFKEAASQVRQFLGVESVAESVSRAAAARPVRKADTPPPDAPAPVLGRGAVAQWCYRDTQGRQLFWVQRVNRQGSKYFLLVVWLDGKWHTVTKRDPFRADWPEPRPLYRLPDLVAHPEATVLIAEGEKAVDAAAELLGGDAYVAVGFRNGAKSANKSDWTPMRGRRVILLPDNDAPGAEFVVRVTRELRSVGVESIGVCRAPEGSPEGWDIADAEGWDEAEAVMWLAGAEAIAERQPDELEGDDGTGEYPFALLGYDAEGAFYYQPRITGQVVSLARGSHTSTNLVALAPLQFWEQKHPGERSGVDWLAATSELFSRQHHVGVYDPERLRGRGAWWDNGHSVLHLGDQLIIDGKIPHPLSVPLESRFYYQRGPQIQGPSGATPLTKEEAEMVLMIAARFRWEVRASAVLLAGWVALAPICGALPWRPHGWITAAAGSGKSAIEDRFVVPLVGDMALIVVGNTSEAGIRQTLKSDALPVIMDEAEANEKADQVRIQNILALARAASSDSRASTVKGSASGEATRFKVRSMFLLSSIATSLKQGADQRRFAVLALLPPHEGDQAERLAHWEALDRDLDKYITPEFGRRLIARTVTLLPQVLAAVKVFREVAARHFGNQALGDQYGTLLAGAYMLQADEAPAKQQAQAWIEHTDWEPYKRSVEVPDELKCLSAIIERQTKAEVGRLGEGTLRSLDRSLSELVAIRLGHQADASCSPDEADIALQRNGLRIEGEFLLVSNTAQPIAKALADTPWRSNWPAMLGRLQGAEKRSGVVRFRGLGPARVTAVPLSALRGADEEGALQGRGATVGRYPGWL